ncbi:MAG: hypothetical protein MJ182_03725 [Treponema sp.]|nr:hypothetical protein [Treponema sp.]
MKKLLTIAALAVLGLGLVSCGSTGGAAKPAKAGYPHPMTYTLDIASATKDGVIKMADNSQYGTKGETTRQTSYTDKVSWYSIVKPNKPQKGDKIHLVGRLTSAIDIDNLYYSIVDNSSAWTRLDAGANLNVIPNVKAGVPFDIDVELELIAKAGGECMLVLAYGEQNGEPSDFTVEKVAECDIGTPEGDFEVKENHKEPKVYEFDLSKDLAYVTLDPEYPWVNGSQDTMADPLMYSKTVEITKCFDKDYDWPIPGDKIKVYWKTRSNNDISELLCRAIENTPAVNWWKEIDAKWVSTQTPTVIAENIKADEVTEITFEIEICEAPIDGISFYIWNTLEASNGSSLLTYVRD